MENVQQLLKGELEKTFFMCSCGRFRSYLWCLHVAVKAIHDGLVVSPYCPPTLNPTSIRSVKRKDEGSSSQAPPAEKSKKGGRPAKAVKGGALSKSQM